MIESTLRHLLRSTDRSLYSIARDSQINLSQLCGFRDERRGLSLHSADRLADVLGLQLTTSTADQKRNNN